VVAAVVVAIAMGAFGTCAEPPVDPKTAPKASQPQERPPVIDPEVRIFPIDGQRGLTERERRMLRWQINFPRSSAKDYLTLLHTLGAILGVPVDDGKRYRSVEKLDMRPARLGDKDPMSAGLITWFNNDPEWSAAVLKELGLDVRADHFIVLFPRDLEEQFAKAEMDYLKGRAVTEVETTQFRLEKKGERYVPVVEKQVFRAKPSNPLDIPNIPVRVVPAPPSKLDPVVADYFKKKGWRYSGSGLVYLCVENPDKPFQEITLTQEDYRMISRAKSIQALDLRHVKNTDDGLKMLTDLSELEQIEIGGDDVTDAALKSLAQCRSLMSVTLATKKVTDAGIRELAALPKLKSLLLFAMTLNGSAFEAFAGSKSLESINMQLVNVLTDDGAKHLGRLPNLNDLEVDAGFGEKKLTAAGIRSIVDGRLPAKFVFDRTLIDDGLLEALVAKGWLYGPSPPGGRIKKPATPEEVREIALDRSKVTDKGLRCVLHCTNVTYINLSETGVTDETLKKLVTFKKLEHLSLGRTKVTATGLEAIAGLPIQSLSLEGCELTEDAFVAFARMPALTELRLLDTKMKAGWLHHIATSATLKKLSLMRTDFDDAAVKHLVTMRNLEDAVLNNTMLSDTGFQELLKLPKLRSLYVDRTKVTKAVYQKAKKEHPKLSLYFYSYDQ
jgi:hypothetical protein